MQIIEKLPDERFEAICDAGVELVQKLVALLKQHGLGHEDAGAVIAVASAGIAKGSRLSSNDVIEMINAVMDMWRVEPRGNQQGIVFDPAHRRPGFVPADRNTATEN